MPPKTIPKLEADKNLAILESENLQNDVSSTKDKLIKANEEVKAAETRDQTLHPGRVRGNKIRNMLRVWPLATPLLKSDSRPNQDEQ